MSITKFSARDAMEDQYDPKDFDAEYKVSFKNKFNATNLAREMKALGYKDLAGMKEQFKKRNYDITKEIEKIIKAVLEEK